ncbi:GDSL-type esterase/lipase family protein [Brevundimonas sp. Root1423]|uniref:GDSL-type esterase/lipase family protein n=1 Tax=Brevundimonas sp. Root1423 TaxID=1736462 RepID=UPI000A8BBCE3|nr:GDSL-type esterase/lipase family protein [Brevundimonas sp. Root1423]
MKRRGAIIAAGLWAVSTGVEAQEIPYLSLQRLAPGVSVCAGGLCQSDALAAFFGSLSDTESGQRVRPVRVVQFGDSHTAGGRVTGRVRAGLQGRFGYVGAEEGRGVALTEVGVVGATLEAFANWPGAPGLTEADLVILAFGVNEGFEDGLDAAAYETLLRAQVERLRGAGRSLLILGAPDAQRSGVAGGCSADGLRAPPPSLAVVRDVQRRVAADMGVAFWDWHGRMGGDCSADRLALREDPVMRGDRVHFTSAGADWIGGVLCDDLMAAYAAWKAGREAGLRRLLPVRLFHRLVAGSRERAAEAVPAAGQLVLLCPVGLAVRRAADRIGRAELGRRSADRAAAGGEEGVAGRPGGRGQSADPRLLQILRLLCRTGGGPADPVRLGAGPAAAADRAAGGDFVLHLPGHFVRRGRASRWTSCC